MMRFFSRKSAQMRSWFAAMTRRRRLEAEMEVELADHLEQRTADLMRSGLAPDRAARQARVELGPALKHKEDMRAAVGLRWFDELGADLRYAARLLRKSPGFTLIAAGSLALAIGVNTAVFSLAKQVLYERLAVPHAAELRLLTWSSDEKHVAVHHIHGNYDPLPGGRVTSNVFSYPIYLQLRAQNHTMQDLFAFKQTGTSATIGGNAQPVRVEAVSGNYYDQLGVVPVIGRAIGPADDAKQGQGTVVVISHGVWERLFGRSPSVLGQTIKINNSMMTVIGVNPKGFTGARNVQQSPDFFVPLSMYPLISLHMGATSIMSDAKQWWVNVMGRTRPGVSAETAQAELDAHLAAAVRAMMPVRPQDVMPHLDLIDGSRGLFEQKKIFAKPMTVLLGMVGFVLVLACANVATLMVARSSRRKREISVRLALGAGRVRILRQMLVESLAYAVRGGAGGLLLGYFGSVLIPKLVENSWERTEFAVRFDLGVFLFTAAVTIAAGLLAGFVPALLASSSTNEQLKETSQTVTRRSAGRTGRVLVGFQIAVSTLLVVAAGLFLRTLADLSAVNVGFRTDHLLLVDVDVPINRYANGKDIELHRELEERIAAIPGIVSVAPAADAYIADNISDTDFLPFGETYDPNKKQDEFYNIVGNRFFETLHIPIVAGRGFVREDTASSPKVAVINQSLARLRFPGQNPLGKRFNVNRHDNDGHGMTPTTDWIEVVGVCGDTRYTNLRDEPPSQFFLPFVQQSEVGGMTYEIQTQLDPNAVTQELRKVVMQVDPDLPLSNIRTQDQQIEAATQQERIFVALTSGFGVLALALASVGIYGIMAYTVSQRTNEIGIRLALGAVPGQIRGMILRESTWLTVAGLVVGLAGALGLVRLVKSMLYGIAPYDPVTLCGAVLLLLGVALAASWIPARRAAGVEPMEALRHE